MGETSWASIAAPFDNGIPQDESWFIIDVGMPFGPILQQIPMTHYSCAPQKIQLCYVPKTGLGIRQFWTWEHERTA